MAVKSETIQCDDPVLLAELNRTRSELEALTRANERLQVKLREAKQTIKSWKIWFEKQRESGAAFIPSLPLDDTWRSTANSTDASKESSKKNEDHQISAVSAQLDRAPSPDASHSGSSTNYGSCGGFNELPAQELHHIWSQSTEGKSSQCRESSGHRIKLLHEDEAPMIVSERCLKRKRSQTSIPHHPRVKQEVSQHHNDFNTPNQHELEALDVDFVGDVVDTPRRAQHVFDDVEAGAFVHNIPDTAVVNRRIHPNTTQFASDGAAKPVQPQLIRMTRDKDETVQNSILETTWRDRDLNFGQNRAFLPPHLPNQAAQSSEDWRNIDILGEGDEEREASSCEATLEYEGIGVKTESNMDTPVKIVTSNGKLNALLESRDRSPALTPRSTNTFPQNSRKSMMPPLPKGGKDAVTSDHQAKPQKSTAAKILRSSLRSTPPEHFKLSDFRLNPKTNGDLTYAYREVVRSRDARQCLPACFKPSCCGAAFRQIAEIKIANRFEAGHAESGSANVWSEMMPKLMFYTGRDEAYLWRLEESERIEWLVEVIAKECAEKFGTHREAHARADSPPGFWRTEMPSTQENSRDRNEADRRERMMVDERLREARKPNGKWLFRDE